MRFGVLVGLVPLSLAAVGLTLSGLLFDRSTPPPPVPVSLQYGPATPPGLLVERFEDKLPPNSSLQDVLLQQEFTPREIHQLIIDTRSVYNLNRVRAGNWIAVERYGDGRFKSLEYEIDPETYLSVDFDGSQYLAEERSRNLRVEVTKLYGQIQDNFYNALVGRGETAQLPMNVLEILRWDVDFTAIQPHDSFKLIFEKKYFGGELVTYGEILAVEFSQGGHSFFAFQFKDPKSGQPRYFDQDGKSVRKAFLKVPFKFDYRISSGFSHSRFHPMFKKRRPHLGVDYAAPYGTPVLASAAGRVVLAGRNGGNGRMVKIRHPNGYHTYYLHLSRIFVRPGQTVGQGTRIGAVGSSGVATGAHLDYRIQDDRGRFINPKKYVALPSDVAVPRQHMNDFAAVRDQFLLQLRSIPKSDARGLEFSSADGE